jgi:N-acetyl-anhydromuramyl-L-alanine amidase AmpD
MQGNFDVTEPSRKQYLQLLKLCKKLQIEYPTATVFGHNSFAKKTCPGKNLSIDILKLKLENLHFINFLQNEK